jgi:hypothetical protein
MSSTNSVSSDAGDRCSARCHAQTSLSAPEIARELYVSVNTVRTHTRHLYDKLGAHRRLEAIDRARAVGLLGPALKRALPRTH